MKENLIEKLYILSFTLNGEPEEIIKEITESFRLAMGFKKVLVYRQTRESFQNLASSPTPGMCYSSIYKIKNRLFFDINNSAQQKKGLLCIIPKGKDIMTKRQGKIVSAFTSQLGNLLDRMSKQPGNMPVCVVDEIEKYKELAVKDKLTGLFNRRHFEECIDKLEKSGPYPVSMIMIDVDGLKIINDTLGHRYGDEALKVTANLLKKTFRKGDIVVRLGGDEFAVLLPGTPYNIVEERCGFLTEALKKYNKKNKHLPVHFSVGFATSEESNASLWDIMEKADLNMYSQKHKSYLHLRDNLKDSYMSLQPMVLKSATAV